jgi:hypothetical protein
LRGKKYELSAATVGDIKKEMEDKAGLSAGQQVRTRVVLWTVRPLASLLVVLLEELLCHFREWAVGFPHRGPLDTLGGGDEGGVMGTGCGSRRPLADEIAAV